MDERTGEGIFRTPGEELKEPESIIDLEDSRNDDLPLDRTEIRTSDGGKIFEDQQLSPEAMARRRAKEIAAEEELIRQLHRPPYFRVKMDEAADDAGRHESDQGSPDHTGAEAA